MEVIPIASSSDGNATLVRSNGSSLLIDCGVSLRRITATVGHNTVKALGALFITHEHADHIAGTPMLLKKNPHLPVYIHDASFHVKRAHFSGANRKPLKAGVPVEVGGLTVTPFKTHHDAFSSHGFFVRDDETDLSLCYIADTGHICSAIKAHASDADILFIECDYDERLLAKYDGYSLALKERIAGVDGHLSNQQALDLIEEVGVERFRRVIFAHLSPRTNSPQTLMQAAKDRFGSIEKFEVAGEGPIRLGLPLQL